jgi:hypothetical protein
MDDGEGPGSSGIEGGNVYSVPKLLLEDIWEI